MVPVPGVSGNLLLRIRTMVAKKRAVGRIAGDNARKALCKVFGK